MKTGRLMKFLRILGSVVALLMVLFGILLYLASNYVAFVIALKDFPGGRTYMSTSETEVLDEAPLEPGSYTTWRVLRLKGEGIFVVECDSGTGPTVVYSPYVTGLFGLARVEIENCDLKDVNRLP